MVNVTRELSCGRAGACGFPRAGARMDVNRLRRQRLAALRADHDGIKHLMAVLVFVQQRSSARVDHVNVAPMHDRHDDRIEVEILLRQDVFIALARLAVENSIAAVTAIILSFSEVMDDVPLRCGRTGRPLITRCASLPATKRHKHKVIKPFHIPVAVMLLLNFMVNYSAI